MANMSLTKVPMPEQEPNVRNKNFEEVAMGYTPEMAIEEATRCLNCKHKPCVNGCPVNVRIPEFVEQPENLKKLMKSLQAQTGFLLYVVVYVHRNHSAKEIVFVV